MGLDDFPRPPTHRGGASTAASSSQYESRRHGPGYSPPSTPPPGGRRQQQWSQPRALNTGLKHPETFLDDSAAQPGRASESGDEPDPHDLALSPKHVTRTSVVDNMLLSLDQFAPGSPLFSDNRFFNNSPESDNYIYSHRFSPPQHPRFRSHTLSSSISSDVGPVSYTDDPLEYSNNPRASGHRSNGSSSLQQPQRRYDTVRSRDSVLSSNYPARNYDEEPTPPRIRPRYATRQASEDSTESAEYDDPAYEEPYMVNNPHRRSMSLDYDAGSAFLTNALHGPELILDDLEAAPTPAVPPGPRKDLSSGIPGSLPQPRTPALSRRNSNKSAKSTTTRKGRTETLGTSTIKYGDDTPRPPLPSSFIDPSAPSPTISYQKPILPQVDSTPAKEKPGFFRRVFGSSKASSEQSTPEPNKMSTPNSDSSITPKSRNAPPTPSRPRQENAQPVVTKKASSFFRRRKKSVVDSIPPPLNLAPNSPQAPDIQAEPRSSPASSLRQVMDPYLSSVTPSSRKLTKDRPEDIRIPRSVPQDSGQSFLNDGTPRATARQTRTADGSNDTTPKNSNEYMGNKQGDQRLFRPQTSPLAAHGNLVTVNSQPSAPEKKLHIHTTTNNLLPPLEIQNSSFLHGPSPADTNTGSLRHEPSTASNLSASDASQYHTASNSPQVDTPSIATKTPHLNQEESVDVPAEIAENTPTTADRDKARKLFDNPEEVVGNEATAAWLGDIDRSMVRKAYMDLFNWTNMDILAALRSLCTKMALKGETQQVDRVLDALSTRWCECNPNHGFKAVDVVHTICYSLLLLNTDLHLADIEQKMTRNQFVRNTLPTINRVACDAAPDGFDTIRAGGQSSRAQLNTTVKPPINSPVEPTPPAPESLPKTKRGSMIVDSGSSYGPLIATPFQGTIKAWEFQVEIVLKDFYNSIQKQRLPLYSAPSEAEALAPPTSATGNNVLRRSPSVLSKTGSDVVPRGRSVDSRMTTGRWSSKPRSRARLYPVSNMGSSRTSLDDQSVWSPSGSSTWSKYSLGKTGTSMSVDSLGSEYRRGGGYQQSIGFANALSHAIIREDTAHSISSFEDPDSTNPLLEDETLELLGAPWAKEGSLKHKQHLEAVDKKAKDRNWNECFAVIQRGWLRLFSFNATTKSMRLKSKQRQLGGAGGGGVVVGGGNWMENAEEVWKFLLRQTIASALPPPGYSKSRPHVWALSLPTGAVHLFQVGTAEIVREFVTTANYWSARLSRQPLVGGVSNMEYGWSDAIINSALINADNTHRSPPNSSGAASAPVAGPARPSFQSSIRSSLDQQGGVRAKLPADRVHLSDWMPPQQSMTASNLNEADQLNALQNYVKNVEDEFQKHNELRSAMVVAFSPRHPNAAKAMSNWERKSSYLLREIVKFRTYIDCLVAANAQREKIYASRAEEDENDSNDAAVEDAVVSAA